MKVSIGDLIRVLRGRNAPLPLYRIDAQGDGCLTAWLDLTTPEGCALAFVEPFAWPLDDAMRDGWFESLPYPGLANHRRSAAGLICWYASTWRSKRWHTNSASQQRAARFVAMPGALFSKWNASTARAHTAACPSVP